MMAAVELENLKENAYFVVPFQKRYPVTLLKQSSTDDIFLGMFDFFWPNYFTKHLGTTDWEGCSFVQYVKSLLIRQGNCRSVIVDVLLWLS